MRNAMLVPPFSQGLLFGKKLAAARAMPFGIGGWERKKVGAPATWRGSAPCEF